MYAAGFRSTLPVRSTVKLPALPKLPPQAYLVAGGLLLPLVMAKLFPEHVEAAERDFVNNKTAYAVQHPYAYGWRNTNVTRFAQGTNAEQHQQELDAAWQRYQDLLAAFEVQPLFNEDYAVYNARMSLLSAELCFAARAVQAAGFGHDVFAGAQGHSFRWRFHPGPVGDVEGDLARDIVQQRTRYPADVEEILKRGDKKKELVGKTLIGRFELNGINLQGANLTGADLTQTDLTQIPDDVTHDDTTKWPNFEQNQATAADERARESLRLPRLLRED